MPSPAPAPVPDADRPAQVPLEAVAQHGVGRMDSGRQVRASLVRGGPPAPELTREHRSLNLVERTPMEERRRGETGGPMEPPPGEPHG